MRAVHFFCLIKLFRALNRVSPGLAERFSEASGLLRVLRETEARLRMQAFRGEKSSQQTAPSS